MNPLQKAIHKLEVGGGMKYSRVVLAILAVAFFAVVYNFRAFRNMSSPEAMDAAQLARNISQGKGYTTDFVRPFSIRLIKAHAEKITAAGVSTDPGRLKTAHPDIANPPVYPVFLAGLMKALPFDFVIPDKPSGFWGQEGRFWRHKPDFLIAIANQLLLLGVVMITFFIARKIFDLNVAWLSALLVLATELLWRFSVSGLSTMLLLFILMLLAWALVHFEEEGREPVWPATRTILLAATIGALAGLAALTRYSAAWIIIPTLGFVALFGGPRRWVFFATTAVVFIAVFAPWIARNISVSGTPFGVAGYAILEETGLFPEFKLQRSLNPDFSLMSPGIFWTKLILGLRLVVQEIPTIGGTWLTVFFLAGLLIPFRNPAAKRMRYFVLATLLIFALTQTLCRTHLSEEAKGITNENLLVLLTPLLIIYGCSLFFILYDQMEFPVKDLRIPTLVIFAVVVSLPLLLTFLPPRSMPVAYPPYHPPIVQKVGGFLKPDEMSMSDVPWAMAWYGQRQCVWTTLNTKEDFNAINELMKRVNLVYLTPVTTDSRFATSFKVEYSWGLLALEQVLGGRSPLYFPLQFSYKGFSPEQLVLTDTPRWNSPQR